jgi:hypothetical protein
VGAFRVLEVALRRARARNPEFIQGHDGGTFGHVVSSDSLPISLENVHNEYSDTDSSVLFRLSNQNRLTLHFPRDGGCNLFSSTRGRPARSASQFRSAFPVSITVVPVLGPVEHNERILEEATVQADLATHRASRHFRNYWYHFPEGFERFAELVRKTWPGMEIKKPEANFMERTLSMFCLENRITRELYWSGFGFQIWCQLLTHIARSENDSLLIVDEPEVYLHPDVQRQMLSILREGGGDVLLATHSTEIMGDADPSEIVLVDKSKRSSQRLRDIDGIQGVLDQIGSVQNVTLTRLARNKRILFVEDEEDFKIIRRFAKQLGFDELASGTDLTAVKSEGFSSWQRVVDTGWGLQKTLGSVLLLGAIYDRDYYCSEEIDSILAELRKNLAFAHVHKRKELENYLLVPRVLQRAIEATVSERRKRVPGDLSPIEPITSVLNKITKTMRNDALGQYVAKHTEFLRHSGKDPATLTSEASAIFDEKWNDLDSRMEIAPGARTLAALRQYLQTRYAISLSHQRIIGCFEVEDVPDDLIDLIRSLDEYRTAQSDQ